VKETRFFILKPLFFSFSDVGENGCTGMLFIMKKIGNRRHTSYVVSLNSSIKKSFSVSRKIPQKKSEYKSRRLRPPGLLTVHTLPSPCLQSHVLTHATTAVLRQRWVTGFTRKYTFWVNPNKLWIYMNKLPLHHFFKLNHEPGIC
jgi:hypothetical protein